MRTATLFFKNADGGLIIQRDDDWPYAVDQIDDCSTLLVGVTFAGGESGFIRPCEVRAVIEHA